MLTIPYAMHYFVILFRVLVNNTVSEIGTIGHITQHEFCETNEITEKIKQQYLRGRTGIVSLAITVLNATELTKDEYHNQ